MTGKKCNCTKLFMFNYLGFELAILDHDTKLIKSHLYKHARDIADCLRQLANFYKSTPSETCVELNKVQACLGEPLIN